MSFRLRNSPTSPVVFKICLIERLLCRTSCFVTFFPFILLSPFVAVLHYTTYSYCKTMSVCRYFQQLHCFCLTIIFSPTCTILSSGLVVFIIIYNKQTADQLTFWISVVAYKHFVKLE